MRACLLVCHRVRMSLSTAVVTVTLASLLLVNLMTEFSFVSALGTESQSNTVVDTPSGKVKGSVIKTWTNKTFLAFRGIPFAEPPVGDLRFKAPVSKKPWQGIIDATEDGKICPQKDGDSIGSVDEDCLNLNIYTKDVNSNSPVIVYFHQGSFYAMSGASYLIGPQYIMDQDIIFVTVNYRLDALGFLSTGDKLTTGNNGLKDQVEALRWVQKHIKSFGGNPNKVTVAGYEAGSTSALLHMLSPMSKGLFHNVIAMSGGVTSEWIIQKDPLKKVKKLAKLLNCPIDSNEKMIECLKKVPAKEINNKFHEMRVFAATPMVVFGPVVEPDLGTGEERFLPDNPATLIKKKQINHVPVVTGITEHELISWSAYVFNNETLRKELIQNFDSLAPMILGYSHKNPEEVQKITKSFKKLYFGNKPINKITAIEFGKLYSDYSVIHGGYTTTKLLAKHNEKPVYSYIFSYKGKYGHAVDPSTYKIIGVSQFDDLMYLTALQAFPQLKETDPDAFMVKTETSFWKNFASTGNPTPDGSPVQWTPVTRNNRKYLNIGSQLKMEDGINSPFVDRMKLWDSFNPIN